MLKEVSCWFCDDNACVASDEAASEDGWTRGDNGVIAFWICPECCGKPVEVHLGAAIAKQLETFGLNHETACQLVVSITGSLNMRIGDWTKLSDGTVLTVTEKG